MYRKRAGKLRTHLENKQVDAFLVTNFYNILYLSGFEGLSPDEREAYVLVTKDNIYLFTDARYLDQKLTEVCRKSEIQLKLIEPSKRLTAHVVEIIKEENLQRIGFEAEDLSYLEYEHYKKQLPGAILIPLQQVLIGIRTVKEDDEILKIKKACEITDECLKDIVKLIEIGKTEKEIAFRLEFWIKKKGYDLAFDPIVAIDANSALAHYNTKTGSGKVRSGSVVLIDFGVKYENYLSDITRMVFVGNISDEVKKVYAVLANAQAKAVEQLAKEKEYKNIDMVCRSQIIDHRLPNYSHSTGHGVGLEIHENPKIWMHSKDLITPGHVVTIEPGVYIEGKWGMRVEDTVLINEKGEGEALTEFSKDLLVIPSD